MITKERAIQIAYDWHGGQWSPLYSFASTNGTIHNQTHHDGLITEVHYELREYNEKRQRAYTWSEKQDQDMRDLRHLLEYIQAQGVTNADSN